MGLSEMMGILIYALIAVGLVITIIGLLTSGSCAIAEEGKLFAIGLVVFLVGIILYLIRRIVRSIWYS